MSMLVSDIMKIAILATDEQKPLNCAECKQLRNGDQVGIGFTGSSSGIGFTGSGSKFYWVPGKVIANDTNSSILVVQIESEPMESYWYSEGDDIIRWPIKENN